MLDASELENIATNTLSTNIHETEQEMSAPDRLADLTAQAMAEYAVKHYSEAAELYSQASELQAEINGDMATKNADLLYSYGKCLFYLAQQTSSVLGGTAASAQLSSSKNKKPPTKKKANGVERQIEAENSAIVAEPAANGEATVDNVADVVPEADIKTKPLSSSEKPYFQISGDDGDWDNSDDEEEQEGDPEVDGDEEEEDDFANAFELLDLARVLYLRKLDELQSTSIETKDKGKYAVSEDSNSDLREIKKRVADIYDLQSEVSLESEKYSTAVEDLRSCLALKEELEAPESSLLAECYYKLSLALEFNSQSQQRDSDGNPVGELVIDWTIRNEAIENQEKAIECCKLRISRESGITESMQDGSEKDKARAQIEDVQDMVTEMEVRLSDLRKAPISVKAETEMKEQISGVLGSILGATADEQKEKLAQAAAGATDLTGLVKRKKPKVADGGDSGFGSAASTPAPEMSTTKSSGKRKVEFADPPVEEASSKRTKVEDTEDSGV